MTTAATNLTTATNGQEYIKPFTSGRLNGRVMYLPATGKSKRDILVIYGHHSLLERWWGLVQNFSDYGNVTMPDIPGFGGMDSFYKVGKSATLDNYADWMADYINEQYGSKKQFSIVGISFGFLVATRMLQRHPELTSRVEFLVSAAGFMHASDFILSRTRYYSYLILSAIAAIPPLPWVVRRVFLNRRFLTFAYTKTNHPKYKFGGYVEDKDHFNKIIDMEVLLWQQNDVRTYMRTTVQLLSVNNIKQRVSLPVWHIYSKNDHFFGFDRVKRHMTMVYDRFIPLPMNIKTHTLSVLATKEEAAVLMPDKLRDVLNGTKRA